MSFAVAVVTIAWARSVVMTMPTAVVVVVVVVAVVVVAVVWRKQRALQPDSKRNQKNE